MRSLHTRLDRLARRNAHRYLVSPEQIEARVRSFDREGFLAVWVALWAQQGQPAAGSWEGAHDAAHETHPVEAQG